MQLHDMKKKAKVLLRGALRHATKAALAAALLSLGAMPASALFDVSATITGSVSTGPGPFTYTFTVDNSIASIGPVNMFEFPLFSATDIVAGSETLPNSNWTFQIAPATSTNWTYKTEDDAALAAMPGKYGPDPQVFNSPPTSPSMILTFSFIGTGGVAPGSSLSGFGFTSNFAGLDAPALAGFTNGSLVPADPPTPNSPARMLADGAAAVPEPTSAIVAGTAGVMFAAVWGFRRLRTKWAARKPA